MRVRTGVPAIALGLVCLLAGCGDGDSSETTKPIGSDKASLGPPTILTLSYNDGEGKKETARLTCADDDSDATGYLKDDPTAACREIDAAGTSLFDAAPKDQACTQIYGGPETLRVTGRVNFEDVEREFARTNGCEIADWNKVGPLLPPDASGSS